MQKPHAEPGEVCPFNQKPVEKVCHKCPLYVLIRGRNPQTGEQIDQWGCSLAWMPMLMIENSQQQRQTGAAVESFRNEMAQDNQSLTNAMMIAAKMHRKQDDDVKQIEG